MVDDKEAYRSFLLQELAHTEESFLKNEEDGERRVATFMVVAGLVAAAINLKDFALGELHPWAPSVVLSALVLFGLVTLVKLAKRNHAADDYKLRMARTRRYFLELDPDGGGGAAPFGRTVLKQRKSVFEEFTAGWVQTMSLLLALGVSAAIALAPCDLAGVPQVVPALVGFLVSLLGCLALADTIQRSPPADDVKDVLTTPRT